MVHHHYRPGVANRIGATALADVVWRAVAGVTLIPVGARSRGPKFAAVPARNRRPVPHCSDDVAFVRIIKRTGVMDMVPLLGDTLA